MPLQKNYLFHNSNTAFHILGTLFSSSEVFEYLLLFHPCSCSIHCLLIRISDQNCIQVCFYLFRRVLLPCLFPLSLQTDRNLPDSSLLPKGGKKFSYRRCTSTCCLLCWFISSGLIFYWNPLTSLYPPREGEGKLLCRPGPWGKTGLLSSNNPKLNPQFSIHLGQSFPNGVFFGVGFFFWEYVPFCAVWNLVEKESEIAIEEIKKSKQHPSSLWFWKERQGNVANWESRCCKKVSSNMHSINYIFSEKKKKEKSRTSLLWCGKRSVFSTMDHLPAV